MKIEVGEYYRNRSGRILLCLAANPLQKAYPWIFAGSNGSIMLIDAEGMYYYNKTEHEMDIVEHLPDCTGFDWVPKPKLQLREGAWYRRKDGKIVGPCVGQERDCYGHTWIAGVYLYYDNGQNRAADGVWLEEEVPDPTPEPVYRPFANRYEFAEHRDRWVRSSNPDDSLLCRALGYNDSFVFLDESPLTMEKAFEKLLFEDGTPFGVKVS
jgi:hypothetical protein